MIIVDCHSQLSLTESTIKKTTSKLERVGILFILYVIDNYNLLVSGILASMESFLDISRNQLKLAYLGSSRFEFRNHRTLSIERTKLHRIFALWKELLG